MDSDPEPGRRPIDPEESRPWAGVAQSARMMRDLLSTTPPAISGSPFSIVDGDLLETSERWCRSYLSAALEHLGMWADYMAPLIVHPDATVHHEARPVQTLARAALESASQAVWVMAARDPGEMLRRHLSLVLNDWDEQQKAETDPDRKSKLVERRADLISVVESAGRKVDKIQYLNIVRWAAEAIRTQLVDGDLADAATVERLYRAASGSAHGKMWPSLELRVSVDIDGKSYSFPDVDAMTAILVLADNVTQYGVLRFIAYAGHEPGLAARLRETAARWYSRIPKVPGAPERLEDVKGFPPSTA